jgi:conjugal transfer pilus assembly protein TraV
MHERPSTLIALTVALGLCGCATHTKGTWACAADRGVACQSIDSLDHIGGGPRSTASAPNLEGAVAVRWWSANDALTGNFDRAPRREQDQFVKVMIAGWTDATGDYHAPSEIYAVMRRGGWWAPPPATPLAPPRPAEHVSLPVKPAEAATSSQAGGTGKGPAVSATAPPRPAASRN